MPKLFLIRLSCVVTLFCLMGALPVLGKEFSPEIIPPNWVNSYDYASSLNKYLSEQYTKADIAGERLYVYLYSDWSRDCRQLRKAIKQARFQQVLAGSRVVMLDFAKIRRQQSKNNRNNHNQKSVLSVWSPVMFQVEADGTFGEQRLYPGKYLDHEYFRDLYRARNRTTSILPRAQPYGEFLSKLKEFVNSE